MSDLLLVGEAPVKGAGKEYFLHCMDWWISIVQTIEALVDETYPFDAYFYRDSMLAPLTPHLGGEEAKHLSQILLVHRQNGELGKTLERIMSEYIDEDEVSAEEVLRDWMDERMEQVDELIAFLDASGGCHAKWYGANE